MRYYAVFGNPIDHSLSPLIHSYFAKDAKVDLTYDKILVEDKFASSAKLFFKEGDGCNITVPFKQDAFYFANTLSKRAQLSGAVNTLKKLDDGTYFGDNTDGAGLCLDFKLQDITLSSKKILIIGAGGATRGIIGPLFESNVESITIVSRTFAKTQDLVDSMPFDKLYAIDFESLNTSDRDFDIVINASSSSLHNELPKISDTILSKAHCVYDLMYSKDGSTIFTKKAKSLGITHAFDGLGMLICQAALSFKLWTGVDANIPGAYNFVQEFLNKR